LHSDSTAVANAVKQLVKCSLTIAQRLHSDSTAGTKADKQESNSCELQLNNCTAMAQQWLSDGTAVANAVKQESNSCELQLNNCIAMVFRLWIPCLVIHSVQFEN